MRQRRVDPTRWLAAMEEEVSLIRQMEERGYAMRPRLATRVYTAALHIVGVVFGALIAGILMFLIVAGLMVTQ